MPGADLFRRPQPLGEKGRPGPSFAAAAAEEGTFADPGPMTAPAEEDAAKGVPPAAKDAVFSAAEREAQSIPAPPPSGRGEAPSRAAQGDAGIRPSLEDADGAAEAAPSPAPPAEPENAAGRSVSGSPEEGTVHLVTPSSQAAWHIPRAPSGAPVRTTAQVKAPEHAAPHNNGCWQCS